MKLKTYTNKYTILLKQPDDIYWHDSITNIETPSTVVFTLSTNDEGDTIKKIIWDFGTGNLNKSITNRKQELHMHPMPCKYKKSHDFTVTVQASVYTDDNMYVVQPITTVTVNHAIKEHYVIPEVFKNEILTYYKTGVFSDDVASSIYKIANRLAFASNFINYSYREEMVGDAVVKMIEALTNQKFDPDKGNPFSYFTKIAFHAFCNRIKKEKKMRETLTSYQNEVYNTMRDDNLLPYNKHDADIDYESPSYYDE